MVDIQAIEQFQQQGYTIARGLFSDAEVVRYRDHYMTMREKGS